MKTWCSALLLVGLICLSACGMGSPQGTDLSPAERLWQEKPAMVGDNSAVIHILSALPYPGSMVYDHVELLTAKEPYGIIAYVKGEEPVAEETWQGASAVALAVVENADYIIWQNAKDETDRVTVQRDQVADDKSAIATDEEAFTSYVEALSE